MPTSSQLMKWQTSFTITLLCIGLRAAPVLANVATPAPKVVVVSGG